MMLLGVGNIIATSGGLIFSKRFCNPTALYYSRAESNQGRKLLIIRRFLLRKLFKGGNYSMAETIRGNTVPNATIIQGRKEIKGGNY